MHTLGKHYFNLEENLNYVIYTRLRPVKGWMCSFNFFFFSIGFIYFPLSVSLCLLWQSAFFILSSFLCPPPPWTLLLYCRCTQFNFTVLLQCEVKKEGQVLWGKWERMRNKPGSSINHFMRVLIMPMIYMMKVKVKIYIQETPPIPSSQVYSVE